MRRRKVIFGILALMVLGIVAAALWPEKPEPVYKGRKLSQWMDQAGAQDSFSNGVSEAVQAIGTNAIPFYLKWFCYRPSLLYPIEQAVAVPARKWLHVPWQPGLFRYRRASSSGLALQQLGERAAPAIPELLSRVKRLPYTRRRWSTLIEPQATILVLQGMGQRGKAAYLSLVTNEDARVRALVIEQSGLMLFQGFFLDFYMDPDVAAQFRKSQEDSDFQVRVAATNSVSLLDGAVLKRTNP